MRRAILASRLLTAALVLGAVPALAASGFATPAEAVDALLAAVRGGKVPAIEAVLGKGSAKLVQSGDAVADAADRKAFLAAYDAKHAIAVAGDRATLQIGPALARFPIPLVERADGWRFDTAAAARYILDRRIGRNELDAIETCRAIADAERDYAAADPARSGVATYAQHFVSHPGTKDGLYWPSSAGGESPLGPLVTAARAQGYGGRHTPYHGYYYKLLTAQGPHAPGGARSYIVDGRMVGGFAVLAYPAKWDDSGVMTFLMAADGAVLEQNLGPATARLAPKIARYDPGPGWRPAETVIFDKPNHKP